MKMQGRPMENAGKENGFIFTKFYRDELKFDNVIVTKLNGILFIGTQCIYWSDAMNVGVINLSSFGSPSAPLPPAIFQEVITKLPKKSSITNENVLKDLIVEIYEKGQSIILPSSFKVFITLHEMLRDVHAHEIRARRKRTGSSRDCSH